MNSESASLATDARPPPRDGGMADWFEAAPAALAVLGADCRIRRVNRAFAAHCSVPQDRCTGRPLDEVLPALEAPAGRRAIAAAASGAAIEVVCEAAAGGAAYCLRFSACGGPDGAPAVIVALETRARGDAPPTGDRRALADKLLQVVADHLPALVAYVDAALRFRYVNRSIEQWFGQPHVWFTGRRVAEVAGAAFAEIAPLLRRAAAGQFVSFDYRRRNEAFSDPERTLRVQLVPDLTAGKPCGFIALVEDVTERVRHLDEVERHNRRLAQAQRAGRLGLWEMDLASGSIYWSPELCRMFGIEATEVAVDAGSYSEFVHPEDRAYVHERVARAIAGELPYDVEHRVLLPDARVLHLQSQAQVEYHDDGRPAHMIGIVRDITDRKTAELALRESEARLRQITETIDDMFWLVEIDQPRSMYVSPGFESIYGRPPTRVGSEPRAWLEWVHADDRERIAPLFEGLREGRGYTAEYRIVRPDGGTRWLREKARRVPNASSTRLMIAGLSSDITERKTAELALANSESMLRQITESTRDVFWLLDTRSGEINFVGPGYARVWGYAPGVSQDALPWLDRLHEADCEAVGAARREMLRSGRFDHEYRIVRADGELRWLHTRAFPIRDGEERLVRIAGFVEDVTDARSVIELTRLKDEAEHASRTKSEFLSRTSHELRTPLNAVLGFAQLLLLDRDRGLDDEQRHSVMEILGAGRHLLDIVDEMLDLTRIEMGQLRISIERLGLREVIGECVSMVRSQALARGLAITRCESLCGDDAIVAADRTRVRQILLNLLTNAIKYNSEGGRIGIALVDDARGTVRVSVRDTGPGLSAEQLERLFVPFQRLDEAARTSDGAGLGLALSKQLAEAMGGAIGAESRPGHGCTFWLDLRSSD